MAELNADPEVMRWIGRGRTRTEQETRTAVCHWQAEIEARGFGLFAVEQRETGQLAGFVGLSVPAFLPEVMPAVEIGWRLGRPFWGQGIATEAAREVLRFAFTDLKLARVVSICQIGNDASERIMRKLGMHLDRETADPTCGRPVRVYAIDRPADRSGSSPAESPASLPVDGPGLGDVLCEWRGAFSNDEVNALHAEAFDHGVSDSDWRARLVRHSLGWVCVRAGGDLVGFVNVAWDGGIHAFVLDTMVATRLQRHGIGARLVAVAAEAARTHGCAWRHVDFEDHLQAFYFENCGFTPTAAGLIRLRPQHAGCPTDRGGGAG